MPVFTGPNDRRFNCPDLAGQTDHVSGGSNYLQRGRLVQTVLEDCERAVRVDLH